MCLRYTKGPFSWTPALHPLRYEILAAQTANITVLCLPGWKLKETELFHFHTFALFSRFRFGATSTWLGFGKDCSWNTTFHFATILLFASLMKTIQPYQGVTRAEQVSDAVAEDLFLLWVHPQTGAQTALMSSINHHQERILTAAGWDCSAHVCGLEEQMMSDGKLAKSDGKDSRSKARRAVGAGREGWREASRAH